MENSVFLLSLKFSTKTITKRLERYPHLFRRRRKREKNVSEQKPSSLKTALGSSKSKKETRFVNRTQEGKEPKKKPPHGSENKKIARGRSIG